VFLAKAGTAAAIIATMGAAAARTKAMRFTNKVPPPFSSFATAPLFSLQIGIFSYNLSKLRTTL